MKCFLTFFTFFTFLFFSYQSFSNESAEEILANMTIEDKIHQLFIFNIPKPVFDNKFKKILDSHRPGSYILFGKDIKSAKALHKLTRELQADYKSRNQLPAFIMIDQEGGHVTRIKTKPNLPSPLSVSTSGDPKLSYKVGVETSKILNLLGVNLNLAPVIDLSDPHKNNFIGNRSFGNDPETVIKFASTQALAFEENSIIPTFKHFPGHGGLTQDSHKKLPKKLITLDELRKHDLKPYKTLIRQYPEAAIMVGHIAFPNIDPSGYPTTFSKVLMTDILRNELGFQGLIMTDDIQMHALKNYGSLSQRARLAFNAGADLLMVTGGFRTQKKVINGIKKAVKNNLITEKRLNESVLRIIKSKLKIKQNISTKDLTYAKVLPQIRKSISNLKINSDSIIQNNINISLKNIRGLLLKELEDINKIKIFSANTSFYSQVKKSFPNKSFKLHKLRKKNRLNSKASMAQTQSLNIFYVTGMGTLRMLKRLPNSIKKNTIVINSTHPGALTQTNRYKNIINVNSPYIYSGKLFSELITSNDDIRGLASE